jgi:hypothetical protein
MPTEFEKMKDEGGEKNLGSDILKIIFRVGRWTRNPIFFSKPDISRLVEEYLVRK